MEVHISTSHVHVLNQTGTDILTKETKHFILGHSEQDSIDKFCNMKKLKTALGPPDMDVKNTVSQLRNMKLNVTMWSLFSITVFFCFL